MTKPLIALALALALSACNTVAYSPPPSFDMPQFSEAQPVPSVASAYAPTSTLDFSSQDSGMGVPGGMHGSCAGYVCY